MSESTEKAAEWVYCGIWKVLSDWFMVPEHPPTLPVAEGESIRSFHPARAYLKYLKLFFWIALIAVDVAIVLGWIALYFWNPRLGMLLAVPALVVAVLPDIVAYIAIHLLYDTMWYVMTDRSLRCCIARSSLESCSERLGVHSPPHGQPSGLARAAIGRRMLGC